MTARARPRKAPRRKPGPVCTVCSHPQRGAIDRALVEGQSAPQIAAKYREISDDAVRRHAESHIPPALAKAAADSEGRTAAATLEQLDRCIQRINLLFDACHEWLTDPDDPSRYYIGPRSEDLQVVYTAQDAEGKPVRRKARLSELLNRVAGVAPEVRLVETKHADPRELVLDTARRLEGQTELLARIVGQLKDPGVLNLTVHVEWIALRGVILTALEPYPEARLALASALETAHVGA
jgi:hypothetical protein